MTWRVEYSKSALNDLKKLDRQTQRRVLDWMDSHVAGCVDPRYVGKRLTGNLSGWRYRVGDYRVICRFRDSVITVDVVAIRHLVSLTRCINIDSQCPGFPCGGRDAVLSTKATLSLRVR